MIDSMGVSMGVSFSLLKVTEWIPKVIDKLHGYKPEIKNMSINYRNRNAEIDLRINIPEHRIRKIEIPRYQNFQICHMMDQTFTRVDLDNLISIDTKKIKIDCSKLPPSDYFLLKMKGQMPPESLDEIVYIQQSKSKDRKENTDKYWLNSMIRNVEMLEDLWDGLNVDNVTAGVNIGIERYLSSKIPTKIAKGLEALQKWASVGYGSNRNDVWPAYMRLQQVDTNISVKEIYELIHTLTATDFFSEFVYVDSPYNLGKIKNEEPFKTLPEHMYVEACTRLTLKKPIVDGFMTFKRGDYIDSVERKFKELL